MACTGPLACLLGAATYTGRRPELDVRQDDAGFVFSLLMTRGVLAPLPLLLRWLPQAAVSLTMLPVDVTHLTILYGGGVSGMVIVAGAAAAQLLGLLVTVVLQLRYRSEYVRIRVRAAEGDSLGQEVTAASK